MVSGANAMKCVLSEKSKVCQGFTSNFKFLFLLSLTFPFPPTHPINIIMLRRSFRCGAASASRRRTGRLGTLWTGGTNEVRDLLLEPPPPPHIEPLLCTDYATSCSPDSLCAPASRQLRSDDPLGDHKPLQFFFFFFFFLPPATPAG